MRLFNFFKRKKKSISKLSVTTINLDEMRAELGETLMNLAIAYYIRHEPHVLNLVNNDGEASFPPYWEDKHQPSLWKGGTWRWFFGIKK